MTGLPLGGSRIGVTAARRAEEQSVLLERRRAKVDVAPAVEMAVARLRSAIGTRAVQTRVMRGYRLAVTGGRP